MRVENTPQIKTPEELEKIEKKKTELEAKIPKMVAGFKELIETNPKTEEEQLAYEEKLIHVMAFPTGAFIFDNENHTNISKMFEDALIENNLIKQGDDLEDVFNNFHKKIIDLEIER